MLQSLRDQSGKWFIKVLLGLIILSFLIWGIADIIRGYAGSRAIIQVGTRRVTVDEYARIMAHEIRRMQNQISPDQLKSLDLEKIVRERLIHRLAQENMVKDQQLLVPESLLRDYIQSLPPFQKDGKFDHELFQQRLSALHMNEVGFIDEIRKELLDQQIPSSLDAPELPVFYKEALFDFLYQNHILSLVKIPFATLKIEGKATDPELQLLYTQNQELYTIPEKRSVNVVWIRDDEIAPRITVPEEDILEEYEKRKDVDFSSPERRSVEKIFITEESVAKNVVDRVQKGHLFTSIAREIKGAEYSEALSLKKEDLPNPDQDIVFTTALGKGTSLIKTETGWVVYRITKIEPAFQKMFKDVKASVLLDLQKERLPEYLKDLRNNIEDMLAGGKNITDIAKEMDLSAQRVEGISAKGDLAFGKKAFETLDAHDRKTLLETLFGLKEGQSSSVLDVGTGQSLVLQIEKIEASYLPELSVIRAKVEETWKESRQQQKANQIVEDFQNNAKNLGDMANLSNQYNLTFLSNQALSRYQFTHSRKDLPSALLELPPQLLDHALELRSNEITSGSIKEGLAIIMCQKIDAPDQKSIQPKELFETMDKLVQEDVSLLAHNQAQFDYTVSVDQEKIDRLKAHEN